GRPAAHRTGARRRRGALRGARLRGRHAPPPAPAGARARLMSPSGTSAARWTSVIGLEVHCQLATRTKLFCACANAFGGEPNARVCPVCLGAPGALPFVNGAAVELALRAALALGCTLDRASIFERKHYFYCDLPKGYQISQYLRPLATGGGIALDG